jgi:hypothetical protein
MATEMANVLNNLTAITNVARVLVRKSEPFSLKSGRVVVRSEHYRQRPTHGGVTSTYEAVPGAGTGHLEGIVAMPSAVRASYSNTRLSSWLDKDGRDIALAATGLRTRVIDRAVGIFKHGGKLETNPAVAVRTVRRPLVDASNAMDKAGRAESVRSYIDAQNAFSFHKITTKAPSADKTSLFIPAQRRMTQSQARRVQGAADKFEMGVVDTGKGVLLINFGGKALMRSALKSDLGDAIRKSSLRGKPQRVAFSGDYKDNSMAAAARGTGAATRELRQRLGGSIPDSPDLRRAASDRAKRDSAFAATHGLAVRQDIQLARDLVAKSGIRGLFEALDKGAALPAVALVGGGAVVARKRSDGSST